MVPVLLFVARSPIKLLKESPQNILTLCPQPSYARLSRHPCAPLSPNRKELLPPLNDRSWLKLCVNIVVKNVIFFHTCTRLLSRWRRDFFFLVTKSCDRSVCLSSLQLTSCCLSFKTQKMPILHEHTHTGYHHGRRRYVIVFVLNFFSFSPGNFTTLGAVVIVVVCFVL